MNHAQESYFSPKQEEYAEPSLRTDVMTLFQAYSGQELDVVDILGGRGVRRRLLQLGILPGTRVRVVSQAALGGPLLVDIDGRVVALGRGIANKVIVRPVG